MDARLRTAAVLVLLSLLLSACVIVDTRGEDDGTEPDPPDEGAAPAEIEISVLHGPRDLDDRAIRRAPTAAVSATA